MGMNKELWKLSYLISDFNVMLRKEIITLLEYLMIPETLNKILSRVIIEGKKNVGIERSSVWKINCLTFLTCYVFLSYIVIVFVYIRKKFILSNVSNVQCFLFYYTQYFWLSKSFWRQEISLSVFDITRVCWREERLIKCRELRINEKEIRVYRYQLPATQKFTTFTLIKMHCVFHVIKELYSL